MPELRLLGCVEVDRVFALPLQKDTDLVAVPLNAKLKLHRAKNMDQLENFIEYLRFLEKAQHLLTEARDRLQIVDVKLSDKEKKESSSSSKSSSRHLPNVMTTSSAAAALDNGYILRKSMSCDSNRYIQHKELQPIVDEYSEIDQIYDYVRGLAPLPKNLNRSGDVSTGGVGVEHKTSMDKSQPDSGNYSLIRNNNSINSSSGKHSNYHHHHGHYAGVMHNSNNNNNHNNNNNNDDDKPIPPPIETIPGKKLPEKRQRPTLPKLYVKNGSNNNASSPHKLSNSPPGLIINAKDGLEPQSPLFHIR